MMALSQQAVSATITAPSSDGGATKRCGGNCRRNLPLSEFKRCGATGYRSKCRVCCDVYRYDRSVTAAAAKYLAPRAAEKYVDLEEVNASNVDRAGFFERKNSLCADTLRAIWDRQGGLCALTGRALQQNWDTQLDHIVPRSRGGSNGASNLQWLCRAANQLKSNLSDAEFVRFCIEVADYARAHPDNGAPG